MRESEIQEAVMELCMHHPKVAWAYITTAGTLRGKGGCYVNVGVPGMPDIMGQMKDGSLFGIEIKTKGEKPTQKQHEFMRMIVANHGHATWVDDPDQAEGFLHGLILRDIE